jgi:predicted nucleotidyltransferase
MEEARIISSTIGSSIKFEAVYLLGSRASGEAKAQSDYDILMVIPTTAVPILLLRVKHVHSLLRSRLGKSVDLIAVTDVALRRNVKSLLVKRWQRYAKLISGRQILPPSISAIDIFSVLHHMVFNAMFFLTAIDCLNGSLKLRKESLVKMAKHEATNNLLLGQLLIYRKYSLGLLELADDRGMSWEKTASFWVHYMRIVEAGLRRQRLRKALARFVIPVGGRYALTRSFRGDDGTKFMMDLIHTFHMFRNLSGDISKSLSETLPISCTVWRRLRDYLIDEWTAVMQVEIGTICFRRGNSRIVII